MQPVESVQLQPLSPHFTAPYCLLACGSQLTLELAGFLRWAMNSVVKFRFGLISKVLFCLDWPMPLFMLGIET
jgi:hypothetical protein